MPPESLLPTFSAERLEEHASWLRPDHLDGTALRLAYQSLLIESGGMRIVVDTCRGDGRPLPAGRGLVKTDYYANLLAVVAPQTVDLVVCTHLHYDHVGWNVREDAGRWVPTFPNAEYLFVRSEYEHWTGPDGESPNVDLEYAVCPIVDAGLHRLVEADHVLTDEVALVPTPGHSPGHVSLRIHSGGEEAWITGDAVHHPVQLAEPTWSSHADLAPAQAAATRLALAETLVETGALVIGTHFASPTVGVLFRSAAGHIELVSNRAAGRR